MTSTVTTTVEASPAHVWEILSDGWLFGLWVTGASRIRSVDATWPATGAEIHHSVGSWPMLIDDTTSVLRSVPEQELELRARAWPGGEAEVRLTIEPQGAQTRIVMVEDASQGPARFIPGPVRRVALEWRNRESLRRLKLLVERRAASRPAA